MLFGIEGDIAGKLIKVDIDVTHFDLVGSEVKSER